MDAFTTHTGLVAPLDRVDVDTDQIIPKQFLKSIARTGFEQGLFFDWRCLPDGSPNPDFVLNQPHYQGASVLVSGRNFGSGSSREHAPWALQQFGFRAVIAPSFADIFRNNCYQNGFLPVALPEPIVRQIMDRALNEPDYRLNIDLEQQTVSDERDTLSTFDIDPTVKHRLLNGLDDIGLTLQHASDIADFEQRRPATCPRTRGCIMKRLCCWCAAVGAVLWWRSRSRARQSRTGPPAATASAVATSRPSSAATSMPSCWRFWPARWTNSP